MPDSVKEVMLKSWGQIREAAGDNPVAFK